MTAQHQQQMLLQQQQQQQYLMHQHMLQQQGQVRPPRRPDGWMYTRPLQCRWQQACTAGVRGLREEQAPSKIPAVPFPGH